jgi:ABC-type glycerol-3-phosphate transport system substrate-binding protein
MKSYLLAIAMLGTSAAAVAQTQSRDTDLHIAMFAYLPDASTAIEKFEDEFESRFATIDLDIELWNPYDDGTQDDGLSQLVDFDVIEVDACRIDQLMNGAFGGLDPLPTEVLRSEDSFVGGAKSLIGTGARKYIVPHWVCGNYLVCWSTNKGAAGANTFAALLEATDPNKEKPVLAAMWGRTTLGEYYADALLDVQGASATREHLRKLGRGEAELDAQARDAVLKLADELLPDNRANLKHFDSHAYLFPRQFAQTPNAVLLGYSERLYYTERERQLTPGKSPPSIKPEDIVVRQFAFANESKGTPSWVDGFVIPKGRVDRKRAAIAAFLVFVNSTNGYMAFAEPAAYLAPSYLLPATTEAYEDEALLAKQPLLPKYLDVMDGSFAVTDSETWQGMRSAGEKLRTLLQP